jgi:uncharacterized protein (TIGR01370 family)
MLVFHQIFPPWLFNSLSVALFVVASSPMLQSGEDEMSTLQSNPLTWAYVLQADEHHPEKKDAVKALKKCDRDWIVIDAYHSMHKKGQWTAKDIEKIRSGRSGRKVLCYLSIGEAEDYRMEWPELMEYGANGEKPDFLEEENPDWPGNYKVRYWDVRWQSMILKRIESILEAGFDGLYLDIVDAYDYFEEKAKQKPDAELIDYRALMVEWISTISETAKNIRAETLIIPQNASALVTLGAYQSVIDGIALESVFAEEDELKRHRELWWVLGDVQDLHWAKKPILAVEYGTSPATHQFLKKMSKHYDMAILLNDRELTELGEMILSKSE